MFSDFGFLKMRCLQAKMERAKFICSAQLEVMHLMMKVVILEKEFLSRHLKVHLIHHVEKYTILAEYFMKVYHLSWDHALDFMSLPKNTNLKEADFSKVLENHLRKCLVKINNMVLVFGKVARKIFM